MTPLTLSPLLSLAQVLLFTDIRAAFDIHRRIGILRQGDYLFIGLRTKTGHAAVIGSPPPSQLSDWNLGIDFIPIGGSAAIGPEPVISRALLVTEGHVAELHQLTELVS